MYALDTNTLVHYFKGAARASSRVGRAHAPGKP